MFCCTRQEEGIFYDVNTINTSDYYCHWEDFLRNLLRKVNVLPLINELFFLSTSNLINVSKLKIVLARYTKNYEDIVKYLYSAFYVIPKGLHESYLKDESYLNYQKFNLKLIIINYFIDINDIKGEFKTFDSNQDFNIKKLDVKEIHLKYVIYFLISYSSLKEETKAKIFFQLLDHPNKNCIEFDKDFISMFECYIEQCLFLPDIVSNYFLKNKSKQTERFLSNIIDYKTNLVFLKNFSSIYEDFMMYVALTHIFYNPVTKQRIYNEELPFVKSSKDKKNIFEYVLEAKNYSLFNPAQIRQSFNEFISKKEDIYKIFIKSLSIFLNEHNCIGIAQDYTDFSSKININALKNKNLLEEMKNLEKILTDKDLYCFEGKCRNVFKMKSRKKQVSPSNRQSVDSWSPKKRYILIEKHVKKKSELITSSQTTNKFFVNIDEDEGNFSNNSNNLNKSNMSSMSGMSNISNLSILSKIAQTPYEQSEQNNENFIKTAKTSPSRLSLFKSSKLTSTPPAHIGVNSTPIIEPFKSGRINNRAFGVKEVKEDHNNDHNDSGTTSPTKTYIINKKPSKEFNLNIDNKAKTAFLKQYKMPKEKISQPSVSLNAKNSLENRLKATRQATNILHKLNSQQNIDLPEEFKKFDVENKFNSDKKLLKISNSFEKRKSKFEESIQNYEV